MLATPPAGIVVGALLIGGTLCHVEARVGRAADRRKRSPRSAT